MITHKSLLLFEVLFTTLATQVCLADTVLAYGPDTDYVTAHNSDMPQAVRISSDPYEYLLDYSDSTAFSPNSNYTGPTFYGGYMLTSSTVQGSSFVANIINDWSLAGGYDTIRLYANVGSGWDGSALGFASVIVFKQADFGEGYTSGNYSPDGFSIAYRATGASGAFTPQGRWLVQIDSTYYLSETTIATTGSNNSASISGATLSSTKWATYSPAASLNFDQSSATFLDLELSNVTSVGIYFEEDAYTGTTDSSAALLGISEYSASGTVIPESSDIGLCFALGALLTLAYRKYSLRNR